MWSFGDCSFLARQNFENKKMEAVSVASCEAHYRAKGNSALEKSFGGDDQHKTRPVYAGP